MTDIYPQEQFIGKTFNEKLNEEMKDYFSERKFSVLGFLPRPGVIAMVHTIDKGEIKAIGGSDPLDIINDNFGKWLAAMHSPLVNGANPADAQIGQGNDPVNLQGVANGSNYYYNDGNNAWNAFTAGEAYIQIGQGATPPLVSDFNIETPFANAGPEDVMKLVAGPAGFNPTVSRISIAANIGPAAGAGTISELALIQDWRFSTEFLMSHDAINPVVAFILGETIFTQYFFQI